MAHESLLIVFIAITALAVFLQALVLYALYRTVSQLGKAVTRIDAGLVDHLHPVLTSLNETVAAVREPIQVTLASLVETSRIVAETSRIVRDRAAATDVVVAEVVDRARAEVARADTLIAGVLDKAEHVTEAVERGVLMPVREVAAIFAGVRRGFEFFLSRGPGRSRTGQEEQLFI